MYFKFSLRKHPQSGKLSGYYRLVESYRNAGNRVCHRSILNVGFMEDVTADQLFPHMKTSGGHPVTDKHNNYEQ